MTPDGHAPAPAPPPDREAARLEAFMEVCIAIAAGDFARRALVAGDGSLLDGIATGLNMMADELAERSTREAEYQRRILHAARLAAVGQLAAGVAHEINNPAAVLLADLTVLQDHGGRLRALLGRLRAALPAGTPGREALERELGAAAADDLLAEVGEMGAECLTGVRRIAAIVRTLLDYSGIESDHVGDTRLDAVAEESCRLLARQLAARATLVRRLEPVPAIAADHGKLVQVVTNLLLNAVQALPDGEAERHRVEIATGTEGGFVTLRVSDDGPGMDAEVQARLFEPFFSTKPRGLGTGLGLSISAEIVRAHGGEIQVISAPGAGAAFEVRLPLRTDLAVRAPPAPPAPAAAPGRRLRVLLVDDEPTLLAAYRRMLEADHEVGTAGGGREAIALLERDPAWDAIVCDLFMPNGSGADVLAHLTARHPALRRRCVISSAGAFTPGAVALVESLGDGFVAKPLERDQLRALVRRLAG